MSLGKLAEEDLLAIRIVKADGGRIAPIVDAGSAIEIAAPEQHLVARDGDRTAYA